MGLITKEEYIESLRKQKPNVYIGGEKVASLPDHPAFQTSINSMAVTYDGAQDPAWRDQIVTKSHLLEREPINIFNHLPLSGQEIYGKMRVLRQLTSRHIFSLRCATCMTIEELSRGCFGTAAVLASHYLSLTPVLLAASEEQKQKYLPPCARGEKIGAVSLTEPGAGSA